MIQTLIIMSCFCVGLQIAFEERMILHPIYRWMNRKIKPNWLRKPLFGCLYCMPSFWGSIVYWTLQWEDINLKSFIYWPILVVSCVYINGVLYNGIKKEAS